MKDQRAEKLAEILVAYSTQVKAGDLVAIRGPHVAEPLLLALYSRCLEAGAHPMLRPSLPEATPAFYRHASEEQLQYVWETDRWLVENLDVSFNVIAETNTRGLSRVDPTRQALVSKSRKPLMDVVFKRSAAGEYRWCVTLFPTEAHAMDAQMSLAEYEDFYYGACMVEKDDPVAEWRRVAERHARLLEWMQGRNEVHIQGEGTDLFLEVGGRTFIAADGECNFPDGEIFTGPIETKTRGVVSFTYPAIYGGRSVEGIKLEFEDGKVVNASAEKNQSFLFSKLDTDEGSRTVGELGIGTNFGIPIFTGETLMDEKMGGTIHLALGASYPETGGTNESAVHWDMVCDLRNGGRMTVDGDVLLENGKLTIS